MVMFESIENVLMGMDVFEDELGLFFVSVLDLEKVKVVQVC